MMIAQPKGSLLPGERVEFDFDVVGGGGDLNVVEGADDPVGGAERIDRVGERGRQDAASGGVSGGCARGGVLDDEAVGGRQAKELGSGEIGVGEWLAVGDLVGGDEALRNGNSSGAEAAEGQPVGCRGHDGPAVGRERVEDAEDSGESLEALGVLDLHVFDAKHFLAGVEIGAEKLDGFDGAAAMGGLDGEGGIDSVGQGPFGPTALDRAERADEDSVHVKEDAANRNLHKNFRRDLENKGLTKSDHENKGVRGKI